MAPPTTLRLQVFSPALLLILVLCSHALSASVDQSQDGSARSRLQAASLARLLRGRRSAELQAPPHYYQAASRLAAGGYLGSLPSKRDDGYWIWMPAHGYMSVPRDEVASSSSDKDSMGNLLRYGRK